MKKLMLLLILAMLSSAALADPPSDASLQEMIELSHVKTTLVTMRATMEKSMQQGFNSALGNQYFTDQQEKIVDQYSARMQAIFDEQLTWEKLEPIYLQVYRENFTQDEVDSINAFYRTPAGRAVIEKMPTAIQRVQQLMAPNMQVMLLKIRTLQTDTTKQIKATQPQPQSPRPPAPAPAALAPQTP